MEFQFFGEQRLRPRDYPRASVSRRSLGPAARGGGHRALYQQAFALGERDVFFHLRAELFGESLRRREHGALRAAVAYRGREGRGDRRLARAYVALEQSSALCSGRRAVDYLVYDFLLGIGKFERKVFHHGAEERAALCPRRAAFRVFRARGRHRELEREELGRRLCAAAPPSSFAGSRARASALTASASGISLFFSSNFLRDRVFEERRVGFHRRRDRPAEPVFRQPRSERVDGDDACEALRPPRPLSVFRTRARAFQRRRRGATERRRARRASLLQASFQAL